MVNPRVVSHQFDYGNLCQLPSWRAAHRQSLLFYDPPQYVFSAGVGPTGYYRAVANAMVVSLEWSNVAGSVSRFGAGTGDWSRGKRR